MLPLLSINEDVGMMISVLLIEEAPDGGDGDCGLDAGKS